MSPSPYTNNVLRMLSLKKIRHFYKKGDYTTKLSLKFNLKKHQFAKTSLNIPHSSPSLIVEWCKIGPGLT